MAKLQSPAAVRRQKVFASVFPPSSVATPKRFQRFEPKASTHAKDVERALLSDSRLMLGIYDEDFKIMVPSDGQEQAFQTHYVNCVRMADLSISPQAVTTQLQGTWHGYRTWTSIRQWVDQIGGDRVRKIFAGILNRLITEFVNWSYASVYEEESEIIPHLRYWMNHIFATYVLQILNTIRAAEGLTRTLRVPEITASDVKKWEEIAITRLGTLRVNELFDIVVDWDNSQSGIEDLKHYATNPATRTFVTSNFITVLTTRLLQPAASTVEILQVYISIIRAFRKLDPRGVLLDRVARVIRRYLRDRDDTVKVIVLGLLSDTTDEFGDALPPDPEKLTELALELNRHDEDHSTEDVDLDWNNMDWMPDPVDAAPDYLKSRNTDVIGSLITLFDSKEVFVRELQNALAERLLRNKVDFDQEVEVLEHLKIRFGSSALQACQVMLRDVLDSRKVDNVIRQDQGMSDEAEWQADMQLHSKILSRLFWPVLQDQSYKIPISVLEQQSRYEKGFESLKQSRKLTWLNALGQVEVELDLEDRIFKDEVLPWQATVIYSFQEEDGAQKPGQAVSRTVQGLAEELEMSPTLVRSACIFWMSRRILVQSQSDPDTFTVLEVLPVGSDPNSASESAAQPQAAAAAAAEVAAAQAAKEAEEVERQSKMAMYSQFVVSMLTNQGAMPLPRIAMMLGIVVPGGFPFSNEELREFLTSMVKEGRLELGNGGAYKAL